MSDTTPPRRPIVDSSASTAALEGCSDGAPKNALDAAKKVINAGAGPAPDQESALNVATKLCEQLRATSLTQAAAQGEYINEGGMGVVLQGVQPGLLQKVAIKLPHSGADEQTKRRFIREARLVAYLSHPNIMPVHTLDASTDGIIAYAMPLVDGRLTLANVLAALRHPDWLKVEPAETEEEETKNRWLAIRAAAELIPKDKSAILTFLLRIFQSIC